MERIFLFDVDGTLTQKGAAMTMEVAYALHSLSKRTPTYISTSGTYDNLKERLPPKILRDCAGVYACSGAEFWQKGDNLYRRGFNFTNTIRDVCTSFINKSNFRYKTGHHILRRPGKLSVSVVGLKAEKAEQLRYMVWDRALGERKQFMEQLNGSELDFDAYVGTNTCIEILPSDQNKSMIADDLSERHQDAKITFFGDNIRRFGNDLPLAEKLQEVSIYNRAISVGNVEHTKHHIKRLLSDENLQAG